MPTCSVHKGFQKVVSTCNQFFSNPVLLSSSAAISVALLFPLSAWSSEGELSGSALQLFREFLDGIEGLGPYGPVIFVVVVMLAEMIPLFPSQPLALASGLLFGMQEGSLVMMAAMMLAAFNAFSLSRGVGRQLAQKVVQFEVGEGGPVQKKIAEVTAAIESGGFWRQLTAIALLRLTPVVPFSASNYVLGVTPVQVAPYLLGTSVGVTFWSVLYASLGGASRKLLDKGTDISVLLADMAETASSYTQTIGITAAGLGLLAAAYIFVSRAMVEQSDLVRLYDAESAAAADATASKAGQPTGEASVEKVMHPGSGSTTHSQ